MGSIDACGGELLRELSRLFCLSVGLPFSEASFVEPGVDGAAATASDGAFGASAGGVAGIIVSKMNIRPINTVLCVTQKPLGRKEVYVL